MKTLSTVLLALGMAVGLCGCGDRDFDTLAVTSSPPQSNGFVSESYFQGRQLDYLRFASEHGGPADPLNAIARMERARVDPAYTVAPASVPANAWDPLFAKMAALEDTRDFDALYLLNVLLGYRDDPMLPAELVHKLEEALIAFKFWYTEPTPAGMLDNSYYWTENHEALYHTIEYLVGQSYPDRIFPSDGKSGRDHLEQARRLLLQWFDLRAQFGFSEWHSNVYYQKDVTPLLTLVEYADDAEIRTRAASILDMLLFDLALHTLRGGFGVTHGRSYTKDKMTSLDDDTWGGVKLLFDTAEYPYESGSHPDAILFARARHYRLPEVILRAARSGTSFADRERMGIAINEFGPYDPHPVAPYGLSYTDPEDLSVWWGMSALTTWEVVPLTIETLEQYTLWETTNFSPFSALRAFTGDTTFAQQLALANAHFLDFGLLTEVNTYTYRTPDYMLSSAIDYRKGSFGAQYHSWQATFDPNAEVFTNHPFRPLMPGTKWSDDPETGGYWNGEASMPRSAQYENVAIHMYAPQYRPQNPPSLFQFFHYEPYTHAYFPQDHFDVVVQDGPWTLAAFRDGYVALYSYRPTEWLTYDPTVYFTNGMVKPFDLRANGGADTVWIVECGRREQWGSFDAFRAAIAASHVTVTPLGPNRGGIADGFDVVYESPSQGHITFGWTAPFIVDGHELPLSDFPRYDNPWTQTPFLSQVLAIDDGEVGVRLDFAGHTRVVGASQP